MRHPTCPVCGYDFQHTSKGYQYTRSGTVLFIRTLGYPLATGWFLLLGGLGWLNYQRGEPYHWLVYAVLSVVALAPGVTMKLVETFEPPVEIYQCPTCRFTERA